FIKSMTLMFLFLLFCMVMMVMFTVHTVIVFILSISVVIHYRSSFSVDILENFLNIFCVLYPSIYIVFYYTSLRYLLVVSFLFIVMFFMFSVHTVIVFILSISVFIHYRSSFSVDILENFLNIFCVLHPSINIVSYYTPIRYLRSVNFMLMISVKKIRMCS